MIVKQMTYFKGNHDSILDREHREDRSFIRKMIEEDIRSVALDNEEVLDSISFLKSTEDGLEEYECIIMDGVVRWQDIERYYSRKIGHLDSLSIDFMMDDYDRSYSALIDSRIEEIINAAARIWLLQIDRPLCCSSKV